MAPPSSPQAAYGGYCTPAASPSLQAEKGIGLKRWGHRDGN